MIRIYFTIRYVKKIYILVSFPLFLIIGLILKVSNIRLINIIYTNAIGHLALEPEIYLREGLLINRPKYKVFFFAPKNDVANSRIVHYWKKYFTILENNFLCFLLSPLKKIRFCHYDIYDYQMNSENTVKLYYILKHTYKKNSFHVLDKEDEELGYKNLEKWKIKKNQWFVTQHTRDPYYRDKNVKNIRDSNIDTYFEAIKFITNMGGFVIRMGHKNTAPLPKIKNLIDYPKTEEFSDGMDIFLCAKSKFFIGTNSGLHNLPLIFKTPIVYLNMAPIEQLNSQPDSISALKLVRSIKKRKLLSFKEMLDLPMKNSFNIKDYKKLDLEIIDNSSNMIRLVIIEFIERMNGTFIETENDRYLQKKFIKLFKPGHYGYESGGKISSVFLRKYSNLL